MTMFRALLFPLKFPGTRVHSFSIQGWLFRSPEIPANALSPGAARDGDFFFFSLIVEFSWAKNPPHLCSNGIEQIS